MSTSYKDIPLKVSLAPSSDPISRPDHWIEPGNFKGDKYKKICQIVDELNFNMFHLNVTGEIASLTEKSSPVAADKILIEDSADSHKKKMVQITNLPSGVPASHASSHEDGGGDEISVEGLSGDLADPQDPTTHASSHEDGGGDEISVEGLSGLLADAQTPLSHDFDVHTGDVDLSDIAGWAQGSLIYGGPTDWSTLAKGTENYVLKMGATYPVWGSVPSHNHVGSDINSGDVGIEYIDELVHDFLAYGSDNTQKVACVSEDKDYYAGHCFTASDNGFTNASGTDYKHYFAVPLPCQKGSKNLYITAIHSYVLDGGAGDYITQTYLRAYIGSTRSTLETDNTDIGYSGAQDRTWTFGAARNCGSYEWVRVVYSIVSTTREDLDYNAPVVTYYYA